MRSHRSGRDFMRRRAVLPGTAVAGAAVDGRSAEGDGAEPDAQQEERGDRGGKIAAGKG